jgi:hypothetical protein
VSAFPLDERYRNDDVFRTLVDVFRSIIANAEVTGVADPGELRTALTYACVLRELYRTNTRLVFNPITGELVKVPT